MPAFTLRTTRSFQRASAALLALPIAFLAGCSMNVPPSDPLQVSPAVISGKVFGGQQPVTGSTVTAWAAGTVTYGSPATLLATTTTDANGNFAFPANAYTCPTGATQVYLLARGGNPGVGSGANSAIALAAGVGNCSSAQSLTVNINEVSTAATAFALAQFFTTTLGSGSTDSFGAPAGTPAFALANSSTIPTLINYATGTVNPNTSTLTIESAKLYTIADILAACVNSSGTSGACPTLFTNTTPPGASTAPSDTLQAAVQIALYPYQNISALFGLVSSNAPFVGLANAPNDFTLGVSYTSPNLGLAIAANTSSNIDIDSTGRVWFPSNKPGAIGAAYFDPSSNSFNGPYGSGISGAPITSPQYLSIDLSSNLWITDQTSGNVISINTASPTSYTYFAPTANDGGHLTGGPISTNFDNSIFLNINEAGFSPTIGEINSTRTSLSSVGPFYESPTGLAATFDNSTNLYDIYASSSATSSPCLLEDTEVDGVGNYVQYLDAETSTNCTSGGVAFTTNFYDAVSVASTSNQLCSAFEFGLCFTPSVPLNLPQGIATDGNGKLWIANSGNGSISTLYGAAGVSSDYTATSPVAYLHNAANGATLTTPYAIAIDGAGNVWSANASCLGACTPTSFTLSELIGAAGPTITPLSAQLGGSLAGSTPGASSPSSSVSFKPAFRAQRLNRRSQGPTKNSGQPIVQFK